MLVIIDNYDSFTYNLVQYFGEIIAKYQLSLPIQVFRNDQIAVAEVQALEPDYLVISPGPCTPKESGISMQLIKALSGQIPILGVCLGHQCIGEVFGGKVVRAPYPVHGKVSSINHHGRDLFEGIEQPFSAVRYHSLIVESESLPNVLEVTATCNSNNVELIMGLRHREHPTFGLQFHPESIFTGAGMKLLTNFLLQNKRD